LHRRRFTKHYVCPAPTMLELLIATYELIPH
jgi:hypothetical protein